MREGPWVPVRAGTRRAVGALVVATAVAVCTLGACSSGSSTGAAPGAASTSAGTTCAARALARLSPARRVGQLFLVGIPTTTRSATADGRAAARAIAAGGYVLYGGSDLPVAGVRALTTALTADATLRPAADGTSTDGTGAGTTGTDGTGAGTTGAGTTGAGTTVRIGAFVATDQEGGEVQSLSGPGFSRMPSALAQGQRTPQELRAAARIWGSQLASAGVDIDLAPVADVVPEALGAANAPIGRYDREYGHTPDRVSASVAAVVSGLADAGVRATVKHFPGLGNVTGNTDLTAGVTDDVTTATDSSLRPFGAAIDAGARFVMVSSAWYPRLDRSRRAVFSPGIIGLLRRRFGFTGLVVSDDLGAAVEVADVPVADRAVDFLAAGGQLAVVVKPPSAVTAMAAGLLDAETTDPTVRARVDAAALAVLTMKADLGLVTCS